MKKKFNLEYQYQLYLQRVKLDESRMSDMQRRETKLAFMGACGQLLLLLRDDVGALEEEEALDLMTDMLSQVGDFFIKESNQQN